MFVGKKWTANLGFAKVLAGNKSSRLPRYRRAKAINSVEEDMKMLKVFLATMLLGGLSPDVLLGDETVDVKEKKETKFVDPSGTWRWESERNGETRKHELRIDANEKHEVTATYHGMIDGLKSTKGTMEGDKLVLEFDVERDNYAFTAKYKATIKGDSASGTIYFESDRGSGDLPWEAKRSVLMDDVLGTWQFEIETPNGNVLKPVLEITKDEAGKKLVGKYTSQQGSELDVKTLKVEKNNLIVTVTTEYNGNSIQVDYKGRAHGNKMKGTLEYDFAGNTGEGEFMAKRKVEKKDVK